MSRSSLRLLLATFTLLMVAVLGAFFLGWIGIDALEGRNNLQFFADSETYHAAARGDVIGTDDISNFITITGNFLGPVLLVWATGGNYYVILLANVALLFLSITSIAKSLRLDVLRFTLLLLLNPLTISSVLSVNKEIISLLFVALFIRAYTARSLTLFLFAMFFSILTRWQLTLFLLTFAAMVGRINPLREYRRTQIVALLLGMSALYVALAPVFQKMNETLAYSNDDYQGSGLFEVLGQVQDYGLYFLVFPLKAAHQLFATGLRLDRLLAPTDIYNDVWQLLHSMMLLVLFIALCLKRRFRLRDDLIYVSIVYMAVFAISPVYSPRYFYLIYVLWAAVLAAPASPVQILRLRARDTGRGTSLPTVRTLSPDPSVGAPGER